MIGRGLADRPGVALLAPPVAWSLYFVVVYGAAAVVCDHASVGARPAWPAGFHGGMALATLLTLLPMLWTGRAARARLRSGEGVAIDRVALWLAVLFVIATLFLALPIALLDLPCR